MGDVDAMHMATGKVFVKSDHERVMCQWKAYGEYIQLSSPKIKFGLREKDAFCQYNFSW